MKKKSRYLFETDLKWIEDSKGNLTSRIIHDPIKVATPKIFKGVQGGMWSPEHLLISSVSSCFMTTCLFYAKQKGLPVSAFDCEAIGQVELRNGKLAFIEINIYPKIGIEKQEWHDKAIEVIELTKQNCLITKALSVGVFYHPQIEIIPRIPLKKTKAINDRREPLLLKQAT